eukprot:1160382-Pelagomonas_calceolata.AAC.5
MLLFTSRDVQSASVAEIEKQTERDPACSDNVLTFRRVRAVSVAAASRSRASLVTPSTASVYLDRDFALRRSKV